jgi:hypothetical protein
LTRLCGQGVQTAQLHTLPLKRPRCGTRQRKELTTEVTENTEKAGKAGKTSILSGFFSVLSVTSVVKIRFF